jgi:putative phosphoribosyl transferase
MNAFLPFAERRAAARALAAEPSARRLAPPVVGLALPRGRVPVAAEVAHALGAPLDPVIVREIGVPWQPQLAVTALVEGGPPEVVVDEPLRAAFGVTRPSIDRQAVRELAEIARRRAMCLAGRPPLPVSCATVVVVDDGIATGTTLRAALRALRRRGPAYVVLAVPVAPAATLAVLRWEVDDTVCLATPEPFGAVGARDVDVLQVGDDEVLAAFASARRPAPTLYCEGAG